MHSILVVFLATCCVLADAASWTYKPGPKGPSNWNKVNAICGLSSQSPINIIPENAVLDESLKYFNFTNYDKVLPNTKFTAKNNGHAVSVFIEYPDSAYYRVTGKVVTGSYKPFQYHYHWGSTNSKGSEHTVDSRMYPGELHFIQQNTKYPNITEALKYADGLLVFGTFLEVQPQDNPIIEKVTSIINQIKYSASANISVEITPFALQNLIASDQSKFFTYPGSLTTPDCQQVVTWVVMNETMKISDKQLNALRSLINGNSTNGFPVVDNFRPVQKLNNRVVKKTFSHAHATMANGGMILAISALLQLIVALS